MINKEQAGMVWHDFWIELNTRTLTLVVDWVPLLLICTTVFLGFWLFSKILDRLLNRLAQNASSMRKPVIDFLRILIKTLVLCVGAITALGSAGLEVSALVASLGLSGIAVSFAMKDLLSNVVAGIMMMLYQPFKVNDYIQVGSDIGQVKGIDLRHTALVTQEGNRVLIPNAKMLTETIRIQGPNKSV